MNIIVSLVGLAIVMLAIVDALNTLLANRPRTGKFWPTTLMYRSTWRPWRAVCKRIRDDKRRESVLAVYGPVSLLVLLTMWIVIEITGWSLLWFGIRGHLSGVKTLGDSSYFSAVVFFTVGFGDILPKDGGARFFVLFEALTGVGTTALVIGYLPTLYSAYSQRETLLLTLDDFTGEQIRPMGLVMSHLTGDDFHELDDFFREWERWCAHVLESHTSFPTLTLWRSQHEGQSWVTAIGVVTDAALVVAVGCVGAQKSAAMRCVRRGAKTIQVLAARFNLPLDPSKAMTRQEFDWAYDRMIDSGLPIREREELWPDFRDQRAVYQLHLEALIDYLVAPRGFWGHTIDGNTPLAESGF